MVILTNPPTSRILSSASSIHHIFIFTDRSHEGSTFPHHPCKSQIRTEASRNGELLLSEEQIQLVELWKSSPPVL